MAISGLSLVTLLRWHGVETLGIFNQVYAIFIVLSQLGVGGVQFSTLKHVSYANRDMAVCWEITVSALILVSIFMILAATGLYLASNWIGTLFNSTAVAHGIRLSAPGLVFFGLNKVLINVVNGLDLQKPNALLRSLRFILLPLCVLAFVLLDTPPQEFAFALTITEACVLLILLAYLLGFVLTAKLPRQLFYWLREHAAYGARGVLSGVLLDLNTRIDILMLGYFTTDTLVGVYSFASTIAEGFAQIPIALRWKIDPKLGQFFASGQLAKIEVLAKETKRTVRPWLLLTSLGCILVFPLISWLVDGHVDTLGWWLFAIMMVGVTVSTVHRSFGGILLQGNKPELYTLMITLLVLGDALSNLGFIPMLGVTGAAIVTAFTYAMEGVYLQIAAKRILGVRI